MSTAKPMTLHLNPDEVAMLQQPAGQGGHQSLHEELIGQLAQTGNRLEMDDALLGKVVRYMTQYGSGGFQGRLHDALIRPLLALLRI